MKSQTTLLASAAALLFLAGAANAQDSPEASEVKKIHCEGVNECKGHGACSGKDNGCAGKNGCKGQGFLELTAEECEAAKAKK